MLIRVGSLVGVRRGPGYRWPVPDAEPHSPLWMMVDIAASGVPEMSQGRPGGGLVSTRLANCQASLLGTAKQSVDVAGGWVKCSYSETREA